MMALTYDRWGGPETLQVHEQILGPLAADAVRIDVAWAGVNPADCKVLSGKYRLLCRGGFPRRIARRAVWNHSVFSKNSWQRALPQTLSWPSPRRT